MYISINNQLSIILIIHLHIHTFNHLHNNKLYHIKSVYYIDTSHGNSTIRHLYIWYNIARFIKNLIQFKDLIMNKTSEEKAALIAKIDHDLYLEGITKTPYQKELDQMVIDGKITPAESLELFLKHEGIIK